MDSLSLVILAAALALFLIPIGKVRSLKAGGVEVSLDTPQVEGAVESLHLDRVDDEHLRTRLLVFADLVPLVRGSRILWIDDKPDQVLGERRLMRALGITVVPASSSEHARGLLLEDADFDLVITDVQRRGDTRPLTNVGPVHEGVNFVCWLRGEADSTKVPESARYLPVIFYAAYDRRRLVEFTKPAMATEPGPQICNSLVDLLPKVLVSLAESRATPISAPNVKTPTAP